MEGVRGRPRSFDIDKALESALHVFWKLGFQGASLSELTRATGLSKPSFYAAFGDKQSLYLKSLERYLSILADQHAVILTCEPNARSAIEKFLHSIADLLTSTKLPGGCFIINGVADIDGHTVPEEIEIALRSASKISETLLKQRLKKAKSDGELPLDYKPEALASFFSTVVSGLAVQAKVGASKSKLNSVISTAMRSWPT